MSTDVKAPQDGSFERQVFPSKDSGPDGFQTDPIARKRKLTGPEERRPTHGRPPPSTPTVGVGPDLASPSSLRKRKYLRSGVERFNSPKRFLLGGNITDPLNLNALCTNEEAGRAVNEVTPRSSPLPLPQHRMQVNVIVPLNINDPLNLNTANGSESSNANASAMPRRAKRRPRHRKKLNSAPPLISQGGSVHQQQLLSESSVMVQAKEEPAAGAAAGADSDSCQLLPPPAATSGGVMVCATKPSSRTANVRLAAGAAAISCVGAPCNSSGSRSAATTVALQTGKQAAGAKHRERFVHGNYSRYYAYRNPDFVEDARLAHFKEEWFVGKDVLDIGCNVGHITMTVARDYHPKKITGIDIDSHLISLAKKTMRYYIRDRGVGGGTTTFPVSMAICYGPIAAPIASSTCTGTFPSNVCFVQADYSLERDELLDLQREEYDVILALSITKWLHLHHGDAGLRRTFKRMYRQLRPGGRLVLEPQQWPSYKRRKNLTEKIRENFNAIQFRPDQFSEYLLSKEVGFSTCEEINVESNKSKGFRRPLFVFTKAAAEVLSTTDHGESCEGSACTSADEGAPTSLQSTEALDNVPSDVLK